MKRFPVSRRDFLRVGSAAASGAAAAAAALQFGVADDAVESGDAGWTLGCFTRPFAKFTYVETLDGIAEAGYTAVGLMSARLKTGAVTLADADKTQVKEIRNEAARRNLKIAVTYYGGPPVNRSLKAGTDALKKLIDNCREAACAAIVLGGTGNQELFDAYYDAVAAACDHAAAADVAMVLKPHGGLNATGPQCRKIVERVGHPAFGFWYDPGNIFYYSEGKLDPLDDVETVADITTGMCVKDYLPPRNVEVNPGKGKVDFPELMSRLRRGGFRSGPLIVETLAPAADLAGTVKNATEARKFLETLSR